jgi:hypothetical protein
VRRLQARGLDDPDLLQAALLHDVGKGGHLRLWHRVAGVLLEAIVPRLLERWANGVAGPENAWWVYLHHGKLSADLAELAGVNRRAVAIMRGSASGPDAALGAALHAADEAS